MTTDTQERTFDMIDAAPVKPVAQGSREVAAATPAGPMGSALAFIQAGGTMDQLRDMLALQKEWEAGEALKAYNVAFSDFKAEAVRVLKAKEVTDGPLKGKAYAELYSVVDAVTPALSKHGLSASWKLTRDDRDWIEVTCTLKHTLGHSEVVSMGGPPDTGGAKNAIQARASTVSYLQRYTLKAVCGVAEGGDDDNGGSASPAALRIELWSIKARNAPTASDLQSVRRDGTKAFQDAKDRTGYAEFANVIKARAATLESEAKGAAHA